MTSRVDSFAPAPLLLLLAAFCFITAPAKAQWELQNSHTTASLRGVDNAGSGVVWASGTDGTVLRSLNDGQLWQRCTMPLGTEKLDFRGIQAWDKDTAIIMSSGPGDQSRLYKTTDGCKSWRLIGAATSFYDSLHQEGGGKQLSLLGDPVRGKFSPLFSRNYGETWFAPALMPGLDATETEAAFAASNSAIASAGPVLLFGTGGGPVAHVYRSRYRCYGPDRLRCPIDWIKANTPIVAGSAASGIFSLATRKTTSANGAPEYVLVAVGGTYDKPDESASTAAVSFDQGEHWTASTVPPHGYRSAVAYDEKQNFWITVGPNGTDISTDDGKNWRALKASTGEPADADKNWNALSLPFVVGPHGRIGRLRPTAFQERTQP